MNKRLIASLLAICITTGAGVQMPMEVLANTADGYKSISVEQEKQILEANGVLATQFTEVNHPKYAEYEGMFKVTGIKGYENNGGKYSGSVLSNAFDGNIQTHWETGKPNSDQFKNEVIITFDEIEEINRIVYAPRPGNKGHVKQMSIYASLTEEGEDFELVASGKTDVRSSLSEFKFKNTEFKRLKFVFDEANQGWSAAGEFMFFTEDQVADKMDRLFTDATMSKVSEEFNTVELVKALELEAKNHPFYESYKENLLNAIAIVEQEEVIETDAIITPFTLFNSPYIASYDETFRVGSDRIVSITNNGGQYAQSALKYAIDDNINTHWETGKPNSATFKNEIIITLDQAEVIDRIVYKSRQGGKGFAKNFTLYASPTTKGDNFSKITTGEHAVTNDLLEIQFNPTNVRRLKFVFDNAQENWASIGDFRLYKEDAVSKVMKDLFTNGLMMEVNPKYASVEAIAKLEEQVKSHPLKESFLEDIKLAKEIMSGKDLFESTRVVTGEQRGRYREETAKRSINGAAYSSFESFGKYVTPGEEIIVYVDADPTGVLPQLAFGQVGQNKGEWKRGINLSPGKNIIKAPTDMNSAALYLVNEAYPEDQAYAPRVRVEGGTKFPTYFHGETDPQAFFEELQAYAERVEYDDAAFLNGNPKGKVFNIAEFVSENVVITTSAKGALAGLTEAVKQGYDASDTMEGWEQLRDMFQTFMGFEENATEEKHSYFPNKFISRVFIGVPHAYAAHGYTGYSGSNNPERDGGFYKLIAMPPQMPGNDNWAYGHEFGHIFNTKYMVHGEVTNNLFAQEYRRIAGLSGDRANWNGIMKRFQGEEVTLSFFENLAILSQLNIAYGYDTYAKASRAVRDNTELISSIQGSELRRLAVAYSLGVGENLLDFFKGWNYTDVTSQMEEAVKHLPKPTRKIEYLHGGAYDYVGGGFSEDVEIKVSSQIDAEAKTNVLKFTIDANNQSDLLGYEILKDGEVIGFTKDSTFMIKDANIAQNENYQVVAYAKDLTTAQPVSANTFAPTLEVNRYYFTVGLNTTFTPLDYVKAASYKGEDLSSNIKVESNVDTSKQGSYEVKYIIEDKGLTVETIVPVQVVSSFTYASDMDWVSATTDWKTVNKDMANSTTNKIKLKVNGIVTEFDKGIGTCANSEVIYNLEGKGMNTFSAHIGLDSNYTIGQASVVFKVIADGEEVYDSGVMKAGSSAKFVNLPIEGVKELKLVTTDSGDGITGDFASWGGAKFTTNSSMPSIHVQDRAVSLEETIDFMEGVTATDVEDGDLTSKVEVVSNTYEEGKVGKFEVVYRVVDTDKHVTEKKAYITVYENFNVKKSLYGAFDKLAEYNQQFKLPISAVSNNAGSYPGSKIGNAIDSNVSTHWETNNPNKATFKNEVTFDLGVQTDLDKMTYAARRGGKGFAQKFEVYISNEAEGDDFILAGKGEYTGNGNDVIEFNLTRPNVRRVKFVFVEARQDWASIGEVAFYKADAIADKVTKELFANEDKTQVTQSYNTLEKLAALREEVKDHPAAKIFEKDLNRAKEIIEKTFPTLNVEEMTYVKLNSSFDLMTGVTANDQEDGDIISEVKVTSNGFTTDKAGEYNVIYTVADSDGNIATKERKIVVYSEVDYLSDRDWVSATTQYKEVRKDRSVSNTTILLGVDGKTTEFEKGIGAHANAEIVYDLSDITGPLFFETYVGVDRNIGEQTKSSVVFEIVGDGIELYNSGLMKWADDAKHILLDLTGISELKLIVTNGGNGNELDHTNFADAKLLVLDAAPKLEIPKDEAVKVGESIEDIYGEYIAIDAEDGDLTDQVEVSGIVDFDQPGYYSITYKVTDSDDNEVTKTRNIAVVDMNDFTYVSDYDWASASSGWGSIKKDESPSSNTIRLTDENGKEVQFEKGLGTHARSVIKYDLTDIEADYFSAYVGVDRAMYNSVGSVAFEVWLDGEKVAETDVIRARDTMEYLEVNLAGAKELMIVAADGGNGNGSDHAVWGDAKFHYANENNIKVNTKELTRLVEEVEELNSGDYTEASWNLLVAVKEEALSLLEGSSTQEQVDEMVERLKVAKENLVKVVNNATLKALIEKVNELEIHLYTAKSSEVLQAKLKEAKEILGLEGTEQEAVDAAQEALEAAMNNLELSKGKAELYKLLQIANQMEESNYTEESDWERFAEWTAYYNELYLDVTIHDEAMYEMVIEGYAAMIAEIESYRIDKPEVDEVNRVELENLITRVSELEIHLYTANSTQILETKLKVAKDVLNVENMTQEAIDLAKEELEEAIDQLELSKGKAELYRLLQIANQMEEGNYTEEADWAHFAEWTAYYNELYLDATTHDEAIYEVTIEMYAAMIAEIESHRIDKSEVNEPEVSESENDELETNESEINEQ